jgi:hypothetical protein
MTEHRDSNTKFLENQLRGKVNARIGWPIDEAATECGYIQLHTLLFVLKIESMVKPLTAFSFEIIQHGHINVVYSIYACSSTTSVVTMARSFCCCSN